MSVYSRGAHRIFSREGHRRRKGSVVGGGTMASAEHEHITGVWGRVPSGVQGHSHGQGIRGQSPPEAESILVIGCPTEPALIH